MVISIRIRSEPTWTPSIQASRIESFLDILSFVGLERGILRLTTGMKVGTGAILAQCRVSEPDEKFAESEDVQVELGSLGVYRFRCLRDCHDGAVLSMVLERFV